MKAFDERGISGWLPTVVKVVSRSPGYPARKPHLGKRVVKPFLPDLVFVPDFQISKLGEIRAIADVDNLLQFCTCRSWLNREEMSLLRDIVTAESRRHHTGSKRSWK